MDLDENKPKLLLECIFHLNNPDLSQHEREEWVEKYLQKKEKLLHQQYFYLARDFSIRRRIAFVYVDKTDAEAAIIRSEDNRLEEKELVKKVSKDELDEIIRNHQNLDELGVIKVYVNPPLNIEFLVDEFLGNTPLSTQVLKGPTDPSIKGVYWNGYLEMQQALDSFKKEDRKKIDPDFHCENFNTLIDYFIKNNYLDCSFLEKELQLSPDTLNKIQGENHYNGHSKKEFLSLLKYFGLEKYALAFINQCSEFKDEIKKEQYSTGIDKYIVKKGSASSEELFTLTSLKRGLYENTYYLYNATFDSPMRENPITLLLSNPSPPSSGGCVVGECFEIKGLEAITYQAKSAMEPKARRFAGRLDMLGKEKTFLLIPDKVGNKSTLPMEVQIERQEAVIACLKKEFNCSASDAIEKGKNLARKEELLEMYHQYTKNGNAAALEHPNKYNFHVKLLVNDLRYSFYDACCLMIDLYDNSKKDATLARLKTEASKIKKK